MRKASEALFAHGSFASSSEGTATSSVGEEEMEQLNGVGKGFASRYQRVDHLCQQREQQEGWWKGAADESMPVGPNEFIYETI